MATRFARIPVEPHASDPADSHRAGPDDAQKLPTYRTRRGYRSAVVTLTDSVTKRRQDYWLGEHGSAASRSLYYRLIAEWEATGRRLPRRPDASEGPLCLPDLEPRPCRSGRIEREMPARSASMPDVPPTPARVDTLRDPVSGDVLPPAMENPTVAEVMLAYHRHAQANQVSSEMDSIKLAMRFVRLLYGSSAAADFGPRKLRTVRDAMVRGDLEGARARRPWSRKYINQQVRRVCSLFRWAASHELVPASVYQQLKTLEPLKRGRSAARETEPVRAVDESIVRGIESFVSRQVWALVELQLYTGARCGELFRLRKKDLDRSPSPAGAGGESRVWTYSPDAHKNAHRGHRRTIYFGPKAQAVLKRFWDRPDDAFFFSPAEAETDRRRRMHEARETPMSCGNVPGSNRVPDAERVAGEHYTTDTYRRAIARGCEAAFPCPPHLARQRLRGKGHKARTGRRETAGEWATRLGPEGRTERAAWRKKHHWHPHQLRHTAATLIRREFGLEAAQLALGHCSALVTEAVYAERDNTKAVEVMRRFG
jgi:integrase